MFNNKIPNQNKPTIHRIKYIRDLQEIILVHK